MKGLSPIDSMGFWIEELMDYESDLGKSKPQNIEYRMLKGGFALLSLFLN